MDALADSLKVIADWITQHITMWALIATGLFLTAVTRGGEEASSGSEVPTVTMLSPMMRSLTPKCPAIVTAPQTRSLELATDGRAYV